MVDAAGGGSSESASTSAPTPEQQSNIQRRLLVWGGISGGLLAFGLVPTKDLRLKPSKPLYFYLVDLMRVQVGDAMQSALTTWEPGALGGGKGTGLKSGMIPMGLSSGVIPTGTWHRDSLMTLL